MEEADLRYMPAIVRFLGYNPLPHGDTWAERLVNGRLPMGLSQKEAARELDVDPSTLARWSVLSASRGVVCSQSITFPQISGGKRCERTDSACNRQSTVFHRRRLVLRVLILDNSNSQRSAQLRSI